MLTELILFPVSLVELIELSKVLPLLKREGDEKILAMWKMVGGGSKNKVLV